MKALYDFEAAEDNELTFRAGQLITILDDSDINWWKGRTTAGGEGLFPVSFVTSDLTQQVEPETPGGKKVEFSEEVRVAEVETVEVAELEVRVDEAQLDSCLEMLGDADPSGDRPEPAELAGLEDVCRRMGPLIDAELASLDRETNQLTDVDVKLRDALALYNQAMADATQQLQQHMASASLQPQAQSAAAAQAAVAAPQVTAAYSLPPGAPSAQYAQPQPSLDAYAQGPAALSQIPAYSSQATAAPAPQYIPQYQQ